MFNGLLLRLLLSLLDCKRFGYFVLNSYDRLYKHSIFYCKLNFQIYFGKIWRILICLIYSAIYHTFLKTKDLYMGKVFLQVIYDGKSLK